MRESTKLHRRNSSRWIPPLAPFFDRISLKKIPEKLTTLRTETKDSLSRLIVPNWYTEPNEKPLPRYNLVNYKIYCSNRIRTTKYTFFTFIPINLWEQFHRWANIYFCVVVGLNWIPALEAFSKFIGMIPICIILAVTALKDFIEDWQRRRADHHINRKTVYVWDSSEKRFRKTYWELLLVGDLIHISSDQPIPADILLVRSSDPRGAVFVETSNLDGESNLKYKSVLPKCRLFCNKVTKLEPEKFHIEIRCAPPDPRIDRISGQVCYTNNDGYDNIDSIERDNVLLRGCRIRNTTFAEGVVLYTGKETKLMLSSGTIKYKRSSVERTTNYFIFFYVLILLFLVISSGLGSILWLFHFSAHELPIPFLVSHTKNVLEDGLINTAEFILCYQTLIPLSLYITVEIIKIGQCYLMSNDVEMYDASTDKPLLCRSLNIPEELGQIRYILSDKTGTLTENKMIFRSFAIDGIDFSSPENNENFKDDEPYVNINLRKQILSCANEYFSSTKEISEGKPIENSFYFFLTLAICNSVMVRREAEQEVDEIEVGYVDENRQVFLVGNSVFYDSYYYDEAKDTQNEITNEQSEINEPNLKEDLKETNSTPIFAGPIQSQLSNGISASNEYQSNSFKPILNATSRPSSFASMGTYQLKRHIGSIGKFFRKENSKTNHKQRKRQLTFRKEENEGLSNGCIYDGESTDELCLVKAAHAYGISLHQRHTDCVVVHFAEALNENSLENDSKQLSESEKSMHGSFSSGLFSSPNASKSSFVSFSSLPDFQKAKRYSIPMEFVIHKVLAFDSKRRRMSIFVSKSENQDEEILMLCKGADEAILDKCLNPNPETLELLERYASEGRRTLCIAMRRLKREVFVEWLRTRQFVEEACAHNQNDELLSESAEQIEKEMELIGVTAVEDKLQEGVKETITSLRDAGIQIWVLTGDKLETALNISQACQLFRPDTAIRLIGNVDDLEAFSSKNDFQPYNLVLSSESVKIFQDGHQKMVDIVAKSESVLCYRMTPSEKANVVEGVKRHLGNENSNDNNSTPKVLAIGDGANDVPMILSADVGVGIAGREGVQALMASDFAFVKFRFLRRLLLVHGHWNYARMASVILYFLNKNASFVFLLYWAQFFNGFSGFAPVDPIYSMLYPIIFTSVQPLIYGIADQHVSADTLLANPKLYAKGRQGTIYTSFNFILNVLEAVWQSGAVYFTGHFTYWDTNCDIWTFCFFLTSALFCTHITHLALITNSWTLINISIQLAFVAFHFGFFISYSFLVSPAFNTNSPPVGMALKACLDPLFWTGIILAILSALTPRFMMKILQNEFELP